MYDRGYDDGVKEGIGCWEKAYDAGYADGCKNTADTYREVVSTVYEDIKNLETEIYREENSDRGTPEPVYQTRWRRSLEIMMAVCEEVL